MRKVYVKLTEPARDALVQLALAERRHPADQAALMLERELARQAPEPKEALAVT